MVAGGIVVALLAVLADGLLSVLQRIVVSPGVSGRFSKRQARPSEFSVEARLADA
jgi:osmoprotectant transport system permease protein